jgi:hypothetical protein
MDVENELRPDHRRDRYLARHIHVDLIVLEIQRPGVDGPTRAERAVLLTHVKLRAEAPREGQMLG